MPEARQPVDEQLDRPAAGDAPAPAHDPTADPDSSPGATAPGGDGRADAGAHSRAQGEDSGAPDADESALQGDVDELVAVAAQRDDYLALAQRTQADFENYRKRVARESAAAQERGLIKLAHELL